jgi:hypothetical protein
MLEGSSIEGELRQRCLMCFMIPSRRYSPTEIRRPRKIIKGCATFGRESFLPVSEALVRFTDNTSTEGNWANTIALWGVIGLEIFSIRDKMAILL